MEIDQTGPDNPAGLSEAEVDDLMAGGPPDDMQWLYPYEDTVFPRGTMAPLLMWNGTAATDAVYVHITSKLFEYKGVLNPQATMAAWVFVVPGFAAQLAIPQEVWDKAGEQTLGKGDTFTIELSERVNGEIRGPIVSHVTIAQASFKGSVYYNSCLSGLTGVGVDAEGNVNIPGSKVLRIPPGGQAELLLSQPGVNDGRCQGCHAVSADGSRLVAQLGPYPQDQLGETLNTGESPPGQALSYTLDVDGKANPLSGMPVGPNGAYPALYPDGSVFLSPFLPSALTWSTITGDVGLTSLFGGFVGSTFSAESIVNTLGIDSAVKVTIDQPATLYDALSGQVVANTGIPARAAMPTFSVDGRHLVFTDFAVGTGHALATMKYDPRTHQASDYKVLVNENTNDVIRPGWPFFLPDNEAVVFVRTDSGTFTSGSSGLGTASTEVLGDLQTPFLGDSSDLYIVDASSGKMTLLAKAMGFGSPDTAMDEQTYLPFGAADLHHNYFPTVSPVAAGGYFWVFFDSLRNYGNYGLQRALWGFAIDVRSNGEYEFDPSHPPFYLPGQEFGTGNNHRAFAALDKCRPEDAKCGTGIDCCSGKCREGVCSTGNDCARTDERCATDADCCAPENSDEPPNKCIANFCAFVWPI